MSESMTVVEIEDVLSSIRRLVSEDLRPTHKLVSAALQKGASKLILTPALRIVSEDRTALPERGDMPDQSPDLQAVLDDIDQPTVADQTGNLPVFGSIRVQEPFVLTMQQRTGATTLPADADFLTTAMSRIHGLTVSGPAMTRPDTIEAVVASVGAAVGPEEWEPDGGEPGPQSEIWTDAVWNIDSPAEADPVPDLQAEGLPAIGDILSDDGTDAALHDLQAETVLPPMSLPEYADLVGQDSIVFNDELHGKDDHLPLGLRLAQSSDDSAEDDDAFITEDVLREIVRDMIREELQGPLGERITRNVRKLVRAEINRALASRDFDDLASNG